MPNPALQRTGGLFSPFEWAGLPRPPAAELYVRRQQGADLAMMNSQQASDLIQLLEIAFPGSSTEVSGSCERREGHGKAL
jgi:hypothetical protein